MAGLHWKLTGIGALTAWGLWACALGFALLLPRGTAMPLVPGDIIAGIVFSTLLFSGMGHLLGRVLQGSRPER